MALSNQGFGSGLTQGFEMMDKFYMNEAKKKSYLDDAARADRSMELKEDAFKITQENQELALADRKKSDLKEAAEKAAFSIKSAYDSGRMADQKDLDTMKEFGFDVQQAATPEFTEAVNYFQSGLMKVGTTEFNKYMNVLFKGEINRGVGDFVTVNETPDTYNRMMIPQGGMPNKPETINGKITGKKVMQTYALPNGMMGADLLISYQRDDGSIGTYEAPMTKFRSTVGKGDNEVGHPMSSILDSGFGKIALSTAFAPYRAQINAINDKQGWSSKISESDKGLAGIYVQQAKDASALATKALGDSYTQITAAGMNIDDLLNQFNGDVNAIAAATNAKGLTVNEGAISQYLSLMKKSEDLYAKASAIFSKTSEDAVQSSNDLMRQRAMPSDLGWGLRNPKQQNQIDIAAELGKGSTSTAKVETIVKPILEADNSFDQKEMSQTVKDELDSLMNPTSVATNATPASTSLLGNIANQISNYLMPNPSPTGGQLNKDVESMIDIFGDSTDRLALLKQISASNPKFVAKLSTTLDDYRKRGTRDKDTESLLFELVALAKTI
tara:strand:+ start:2188 stop:3855 length:1668 start_codon:yes stop_codon:yes gene_type:complete